MEDHVFQSPGGIILDLTKSTAALQSTPDDQFETALAQGKQLRERRYGAWTYFK